MNRLVIIGNGFDLAHGLPTRYEDFLLAYFKGKIESAVAGEDASDELITIHYFRNHAFDTSWRDCSSMKMLLSNRIVYWKNLDPNRPPHQKELQSKRAIHIAFNSNFFRDLMIDKNWTDIEKYYFNYILKEAKLNVGYDIRLISKVNVIFEALRHELHKYVARVNETQVIHGLKSVPLNSIIDRCYRNYGRSESYSTRITRGVGFQRKFFEVDHVYFVNFNYTCLVKKYLEWETRPPYKSKVIPIHGSVAAQSDVIFGYGDDTHPKYQELEDEDEFELLKNMKPFYYGNSIAYNDVMRFIESDIFDVHVIGHSLGLSDRVLLKAIFENDNCRAIRLFHRGTQESYFKNRVAVSRHFSDKHKMRLKILEYDQDDKIVCRTKA